MLRANRPWPWDSSFDRLSDGSSRRAGIPDPSGESDRFNMSMSNMTNGPGLFAPFVESLSNHGRCEPFRAKSRGRARSGGAALPKPPEAGKGGADEGAGVVEEGFSN